MRWLKMVVRRWLEIHADTDRMFAHVSQEFLDHEERAKASLEASFDALDRKFKRLEEAHRVLIRDIDAWIGVLTPLERSLLAEKLRKRRARKDGTDAVLDRVIQAEERSQT
ncbi:MAG TPA: hypothetical protein VFH61_18875 [Thermoleophilia bacterium]|nr:hypothetical protein [Thermoleophilia bacterium]